MMTIGSLFAGIGGIELGLERAGLGPVLWQVEIDPFCRQVLAKHWPRARRFLDVTTSKDLPYVDCICGGFPCQDVSSAGNYVGLSGARSRLWGEFARIVGESKPRYVVVENVDSGKHLWLPTVRRDLHLLGYDTAAYALSAADVGAPHLRRRIFVVAHADGSPIQRAAHPADDGVERSSGDFVDPHAGGESIVSFDAETSRMSSVERGAWSWPPPPFFCRMDDGISRKLDVRRLKALGNGVVPQCAEVIGRIVLEMAKIQEART